MVKSKYCGLTAKYIQQIEISIMVRLKKMQCHTLRVAFLNNPSDKHDVEQNQHERYAVSSYNSGRPHSCPFMTTTRASSCPGSIEARKLFTLQYGLLK